MALCNTVLVIGGGGYLGQFVLDKLVSSDCDCFYTFHSGGPLPFEKLTEKAAPRGFQVDLASGDGLAACLSEIGSVDVVINCAAISQPKACEADPDLAERINVPATLLKHLQSASPDCLFIHLSTDQVYAGTKSFYDEDDETCPVNAYGKSKVKAEEAIRELWPSRHVILRSSIIYGPNPPVRAVSRNLFLQWMASALASNPSDPIDFFEDEYRCPVFVTDIVSIILKLIGQHKQGTIKSATYNMGGPDRLSRVDMARAVAQFLGVDESSTIKAVPASTFNRGVASPADISMNIEKIKSNLGIELASFKDALPLCVPTEAQ